MRLSFKFRTVTACLILFALTMTLILPPNGLQREQLWQLGAYFEGSLIFGRAHVGLTAILLITMATLSLVLLLMPKYSRTFAIVILLACVLALVIAFCFAFRFPAVWLLPTWAAWRLAGGVKTSKKTD